MKAATPPKAKSAQKKVTPKLKAAKRSVAPAAATVSAPLPSLAALPAPTATSGVIVAKSGLRGLGVIYSAGGERYDVDIAFQDPKKNSNKFYKMQVVALATGKFAFVQNWGRIGTEVGPARLFSIALSFGNGDADDDAAAACIQPFLSPSSFLLLLCCRVSARC